MRNYRKYKDEFVVKVHRRITAWEETSYIVSANNVENATKAALEEMVYRNNITARGIIEQKREILLDTVERLTQEQSWILTPGANCIYECSKGDLVTKVTLATKRKYKKIPKKSKFEQYEEVCL